MSIYNLQCLRTGFHEAIGDVFALSTSTPKHLEKIGLLKNYEYDNETKINELYEKALQKIVFLPFAYSLDQYRWALFRGEVEPDDYNCKFWQIREMASGVKPPVQRYKEDFDPPAKFHISADVEYLRFVLCLEIFFIIIGKSLIENQNIMIHLQICDIVHFAIPNIQRSVYFSGRI